MAFFPANSGEDTSAVTYENIALVSAYTGSTIKAARKGNVVTFIVGGFSDEISTWTTVNQTAFPEKYRPPQHIEYYTVTAPDSNNNTSYALIEVRTDGYEIGRAHV